MKITGLCEHGQGKNTLVLPIWQFLKILLPETLGDFSKDWDRFVDLPRIDLKGEGTYEGKYTVFPYASTYSILVFAKNKKGNVFLPYIFYLNMGGGTRTRPLFVAGWNLDPIRITRLFKDTQWVIDQRQVTSPEILIQPDPNTLKNRLFDISLSFPKIFSLFNYKDLYSITLSSETKPKIFYHIKFDGLVKSHLTHIGFKK